MRKAFRLPRPSSFAAPRSLKFQLLARSLLVLSVLLLSVGIFQYIFMRHFLYKNTATSFKTQIPSIIKELFSPDNNRPGSRNFDPFRFSMQGTTVLLIDTDGNFYNPYQQDDAEHAPRLAFEVYEQALNRLDNHDIYYRVAKDDRGVKQLVVLQAFRTPERTQGVIQISTGVKPLSDVLLRQLLIYLSLSLAALLVGILAFLPVLRRTLVPLSRIVDKVEVIDAGNLNDRLPTDQGQFEIDRLAASFNGMLERLETSFEVEKEAKEQMRRFAADASHELRTPLTSIHGFIEVLLRGAASRPEQLQRSLNSMYTESERMNKLVRDLLLLTRLDGAPALDMQPGQLADAVRDLEPHLYFIAGDREIRLSLQGTKRAVFDQDKIKQVILNLFQNAVQHTDPVNGTVDLSIEDAPDGVILAVRDNGHGIEKEHLPHLFDRFYRVDTSRARKSGGSGLGLAITKSIVDFHGGSIYVESKPESGSVFKVWLPEASRQLKPDSTV